MKNSKTINGIITKISGGFYYVEAADTTYECKARGVFRKLGITPLVGDFVTLTVPEDGYCSVDSIKERKNSLVRPALANLDRLFIVSSVKEPDCNLYLIDKMTAAAFSKDIEPVIIFSKSDLADTDSLVEIYRKVDIKAFDFSVKDLKGLDKIKALIKDKTSAFCGNSGVGKSTLLNALFPELCLQTGEISDKLGRGRHTTRTVELFKKYGGYVADTPGFSTLDIERFELIRKDDLKFAFPEFDPYFGKCRFNSCNHLCEKGCAVLRAVEEGVIPSSRHQSYLKMYDEVKDIKEWQLKN
ncbi:MAG: ribosome small subunit-dependent GTPase A [Ruminococcus sp.]|nr:ribosome small subunit-dependent GTPase A [Ruminococcus sp.]